VPIASSVPEQLRSLDGSHEISQAGAGDVSLVALHFMFESDASKTVFDFVFDHTLYFKTLTTQFNIRNDSNVNTMESMLY